MQTAGSVAENNNLVGDSHPTQTMQSSSPSLLSYTGQDLKTKATKAQVESGSSTLKNEAVSRKAFALQDKVILVLNSFIPNGLSFVHS